MFSASSRVPFVALFACALDSFLGAAALRGRGFSAVKVTRRIVSEHRAHEMSVGAGFIGVVLLLLLTAAFVFWAHQQMAKGDGSLMKDGESSTQAHGLLETWTKNKKEPPEARLRRLMHALDELEQSEDSPPGYIRKEDLEEVLVNPDIAAEFQKMGLWSKDAHAIFNLLDRGGLVSIDELVDGCTARMRS